MIGVFDSGVGGLSVLNEIREVLPQADLVYVADRARAPYGTRTLADVRTIAHDVAGWLVDRGASCLVVACNTASAAALESLRASHTGLPIVGMEPAVKPAAVATRSRRVGVLATAATFQGELFSSVVDRFASDVEVVPVACPRWVELVEAGIVSGLAAEGEVTTVVSRLMDDGVDTLVLACTHFSFLKPIIEKVSGVDVIDPAPAVAAQTARVAPEPVGSAGLTLTASGDTREFSLLAAALASRHEAVIPFAS